MKIVYSSELEKGITIKLESENVLIVGNKELNIQNITENKLVVNS